MHLHFTFILVGERICSLISLNVYKVQRIWMIVGRDIMVTRNVPWMGVLNSASTLKQYFVLPLNGSKYYLSCTFTGVHVLGILDPCTSVMVKLSFQRPIFVVGMSHNYLRSNKVCWMILILFHTIFFSFQNLNKRIRCWATCHSCLWIISCNHFLLNTMALKCSW